MITAEEKYIYKCHSERIRQLAEQSRNPDQIGIPPLIHYRGIGRDDKIKEQN